MTFRDLAEFWFERRPLQEFPRQPLILTFDDGYETLFSEAWPLLAKHQFRAELFLLSDSNILENNWDEPERDNPRRLLSLEQKKTLLQSGTFSLGSHGIDHQALPDLSDEEILHQMSKSKKDLEAILGQSIFAFAYPFGKVDSRLPDLALKSGYAFAVNTDRGGLIWALRAPLAFSSEYLSKRNSFFALEKNFFLVSKILLAKARTVMESKKNFNFCLGVGLSFVFSCSSLKTSPPAKKYEGLGTDSVPAATIAKYAPAPLPQNITAPIQNLLDLRPPGAGMYEPKSQKLFFTWRVTGFSQVWRLDSPKSFPIQMTGGGDSTRLESLTPDGKFLILSRDRGGEENPGLYLQSTQGGPLIELQHKKGIQTNFEFVSEDSKTLYFVSNDVQPESFFIYKMDLATKTKSVIWNQPGVWEIADHQKENFLLLVKLKGSLAREFWLLDLKTLKAEPVLGQNENQNYSMSFGPKPQTYWVSTNKFSDFRRGYFWDQKNFAPVTPEIGFDIETFFADRAGKRLYWTTNENGFTKLFGRDIKTREVLQFPSFAGADHVNVGHITKDGRFAHLSVNTSFAPQQSFVWDWETKKLTQWVLPSTPEIDPQTFAKSELKFFPARDGTPIPLFVRTPKTCEDRLCPVVVSFHGGPEAQSRPGFSPFAQAFVGAGFIYVEPNVRGSSGYGRKWLDADNGAARLQVITDIEDCAQFVKKNWAREGVAPKVGVTGYSYGGYSTLMAMSRFAGAYDAGVALVGMSNLVSFLKNTAPYRRVLRISEYGDPEKDLAALEKLSPLTYLDQIRAPLMVIQGVNDPRVPVGEALQIHESLAKKNIKSELILFADEGHGSGKRSNQVLEIGHTVQFFKKHLGE